LGQEFIIKSQNLEDKVNQLLPSQGGFQAGVDLSASTQIIPIVDLTETAEGSTLRQDLQTSLSHDSVTPFSVSNTNSILVTTTGYYRVFGVSNVNADTSFGEVFFRLNDGATQKIIWRQVTNNTTNAAETNLQFDFIVKLDAGDDLNVTVTNADSIVQGCTRQIATLSGELVNP